MNYYSRSDWGAKPAKRAQASFIAADVAGVCIHYSGSGSLAAADPFAHLRGIQEFYFRGANSGDDYSDIAYNVAVSLAGDVFEARGWTYRGGANGTTSSNSRFPSIYLMMGDKDEVTPEMVKGVRYAIERFRSLYPNCHEIRGHQEFYGTPCPGPAMALVRDGSFESLKAAVEPALTIQEDAMFLARPKGYWDTYLFGAGEPKHIHQPADVQLLVDQGLIAGATPGTPYAQVVKVWPVTLMNDLTDFASVKPTPSGE